MISKPSTLIRGYVHTNQVNSVRITALFICHPDLPHSTTTGTQVKEVLWRSAPISCWTRMILNCLVCKGRFAWVLCVHLLYTCRNNIKILPNFIGTTKKKKKKTLVKMHLHCHLSLLSSLHHHALLRVCCCLCSKLSEFCTKGIFYNYAPKILYDLIKQYHILPHLYLRLIIIMTFE